MCIFWSSSILVIFGNASKANSPTKSSATHSIETKCTVTFAISNKQLSASATLSICCLLKLMKWQCTKYCASLSHTFEFVWWPFMQQRLNGRDLLCLQVGSYFALSRLPHFKFCIQIMVHSSQKFHFRTAIAKMNAITHDVRQKRVLHVAICVLCLCSYLC